MSVDGRPIPRATYRLQLNEKFTFRHVEAIADYLGKLGISHAYLSPILKARPGSTHGYDTVDHRLLNPELGTLDDFRRMAGALRAAGVSIILDIVPNHMGVGGDQNDLWLDVLEWGKESPYADWFDINWDPLEPTLKDKILVPFLGHGYGEALAAGALELRFDGATGDLAIWAEGAHKLPIRPADYLSILASGGDGLSGIVDRISALTTRPQSTVLKAAIAAACAERPELRRAIENVVGRINSAPGRAELAELIGRQHWRAARYSVAADDINYRRFFIVSDLAAIRSEREAVFDHVHALTFQLVAEGLVDGLRVDHIDGLHDPKAYCAELRRKCPRPIYLIVEKILAPGEMLRADWDVEGTTGYEFSGAVTRLLTDPAAESSLSEAYEDFTGRTETLEQIERSAKLDIMDFEMAAELEALSMRLREVAVADPRTADLSRNALRLALRAVVGELQVYRTYVEAGAVSEDDRRTVDRAVDRARAATPGLDPAVFEFVRKAMTATAGPSLEVAQRIQQYSGPVMAKGLEDTALYRFNRLIALSDVGEKPDQFTQSMADMHAFMRMRLTEQRHGLLGTSSHDTKRGEDTRARIAAISGHWEEWARLVPEWRDMLAAQGAPEIDANDAYYLFQLLLGAWPTVFGPEADLPAQALDDFRERLAGAMMKSIREARLRTNWNVPNSDYESRVSAFVSVALAPDTGNRFLASFRRFEQAIAWEGAQNGLIVAVLKLTLPGVPDIYQGAELWEQSMVDPDNRRAVDFPLRRALLDGVAGVELRTLAGEFRTGAIKLAVISKLLAFRATSPALFVRGGYDEVKVTGPDADRVLAFERQDGNVRLLVVVALRPGRGPASATLEGFADGDIWSDVLSHRDVTLDGDIGAICGDLPFAVLMRSS